MAQIGILHGNKESFPQAVMEGLNRHQKGCCRFLCADALHGEDHTRWGWDPPVILDLFSGQMPYLKEALHLLAHDPERTILNCPKLCRLHNRATLRQVAAKVGLRTPQSSLLPARSVGPKFPEQGYVNLRFPLAWEEIFKSAGSYPYLQALDFDREPGVTVEDLGALWRRYNETGPVLQELVEAPKTDDLYRVFAIGDGRFVRPLEPLTRQLMPADSNSERNSRALIEAADGILARVPFAISAFDLGVGADGVEYIDSNPDPYLEWWVLGEADFGKAVDAAIELLKPLLKRPTLSPLGPLAGSPAAVLHKPSDKPSAATPKTGKKKGNG